MSTARMTRVMVTVVAKEYLADLDRDELFDIRLKWGETVEFPVYSKEEDEISIVKVRSGGKFGGERHEYYIRANTVDIAHEILGDVCEKRMFRCLRWMP